MGGRGVQNSKFPKVVRRGCKRSLGPTAQRSRKSLLHHRQPCFALVPPQVAPVQEAFCSLGSKDLLHPLLTTFGDFPVFDPSPRHSGLLRMPQKECGKRSSITFFRLRDAFGHFSVTFSDASVTFFVTFLPNSFCRTPFAAAG